MAWDEGLFHLINQGIGTSWLDSTMVALSSAAMWIIVGTCTLLYGLIRTSKPLLQILAISALAISLSDLIAFRVLKPVIDRERPCYQLEEVRLVADRCGSRVSFPSNHASNSMAAAVSSALLIRRLAVLWVFLIPILVGFSRVYLGVHFPGDVAGGFFFGGLVGAASFAFWIFIRKYTQWFRNHGNGIG